jgi:hypothetical protein
VDHNHTSDLFNDSKNKIENYNLNVFSSEFKENCAAVAGVKGIAECSSRIQTICPRNLSIPGIDGVAVSPTCPFLDDAAILRNKKSRVLSLAR